MKRLTSTELPHVPVLAGFPILRSDKEDQKESYRIAMLTLFHPWSDNEASPLKPEGCDWDTAFDDMDATLSPKHCQISSNMQLLYQSRDAKHDYSELRRRRMAELVHSSVLSSSRHEDDTGTYDPAWENAMQTDIDGAGTYGEDLTSTVSLDTRLLHCAAESTGFYRVSKVLSHVPAGVKSLAGDNDALLAEKSALAPQSRWNEFTSARCQEDISNIGKNLHRRVTDDMPLPGVTTHSVEQNLAALLRQQYGCKDLDSGSQFTALNEWQEAAVYLV